MVLSEGSVTPSSWHCHLMAETPTWAQGFASNWIRVFLTMFCISTGI